MKEVKIDGVTLVTGKSEMIGSDRPEECHERGAWQST